MTDEIRQFAKRPEELPFELPTLLVESINEWLDASFSGLDFSDLEFACLTDEMISNMRMVDEDTERILYHYYLEAGWTEDNL